jgi:hypothetical protein
MSNTNKQTTDIPYMKTLSECLAKAVEYGFVEDYVANAEGLTCRKTGHSYAASEIIVENFYRFEGPSDPADNSILYLIETSNGHKGTLVDAYGAYADRCVDELMTRVKKIHKQGADDVAL